MDKPNQRTKVAAVPKGNLTSQVALAIARGEPIIIESTPSWYCECGRRKKRKSYVQCDQCGKSANQGPGIGFTC